MAKRTDRILLQLRSSVSTHTYHTQKNKRTQTERLALRKYDPIVQQHVTYREAR